MRASLLLIALIVAASPAQAQNTQPVEVTPYLAVGSGGTSPVGVSVTFPIRSNLGVETDVAYRHGEGIHALSASGSVLYFLPRAGRTTPYLAGGIGLSQYGSPVLSSSGSPSGTASRLSVDLNMGGGLKVPLKDTLDLRTDARYYQAVGRQGWQGFRVAQGISFDTRKR
jgi:hypothetical protein